MLDIGFMQGRAGPKYLGRYQAHPVGNWSHEFKFAQDNGFKYIEFIADLENFELNPLFSSNGIQEILNEIAITGVSVRSICADCFMDLPFHSKNTYKRKSANKLLSTLISSAAKIGCEIIVIPCVDRSSLNSTQEKNILISELNNRVSELEKYNIQLSLETDLPPVNFANILKKLPEVIGVNYDIGNSASLGYNLLEEFNTYGHRINDIHIKDRLLGGEPVFLGTGAADLTQALKKINKINFTGPLIMQTFRDDLGTKLLLNQLDYLRELGW